MYASDLTLQRSPDEMIPAVAAGQNRAIVTAAPTNWKESADRPSTEAHARFFVVLDGSTLTDLAVMGQGRRISDLLRIGGAPR